MQPATQVEHRSTQQIMDDLQALLPFFTPTELYTVARPAIKAANSATGEQQLLLSGDQVAYNGLMKRGNQLYRLFSKIEQAYIIQPDGTTKRGPETRTEWMVKEQAHYNYLQMFFHRHGYAKQLLELATHIYSEQGQE